LHGKVATLAEHGEIQRRDALYCVIQGRIIEERWDVSSFRDTY